MSIKNNINDDIGITGYIIGSLFLIFIIITGIISYKSIDWDVLRRVESQKLMVPAPATPSAQPKVTTPANKK